MFTDMPEKREGQEIVRFYIPAELKEKFKLYCQLRGITMTQFVENAIKDAVESEDFSALLAQRLGK